MAWWTGQPVYGSNPVSKFIRENFAYLKQYVDYIVNSGVTTADLAAVHASPPTLAAVVNITVNTTIGATEVGLGGGYNISGGVVLTINGAFSAPLTQIFFGAGTVVFAAGSVPGVYPEWWGTDAAAIEAAVLAYTHILWSSKTYVITSMANQILTTAQKWTAEGPVTIKYTGASTGYMVDLWLGGDFVMEGPFTFDANNLAGTALRIDNDKLTMNDAVNLTLIDVKATNCYSDTNGRNAIGIYSYGAFDVLKHIRCSAVNVNRLAGLAGLPACIGLGYGHGGITNYARLVVIEDPYIENITAADAVGDPTYVDMDGINVSGPAANANGGKKMDTTLIVRGGYFTSCYGRSIKSQMESNFIDGPTFVKDASMTKRAMTSAQEIDFQYGSGVALNGKVRYSPISGGGTPFSASHSIVNATVRGYAAEEGALVFKEWEVVNDVPQVTDALPYFATLYRIGGTCQSIIVENCTMLGEGSLEEFINTDSGNVKLIVANNNYINDLSVSLIYGIGDYSGATVIAHGNYLNGVARRICDGTAAVAQWYGHGNTGFSVAFQDGAIIPRANPTIADGGTITHYMGTTPRVVVATGSVAGDIITVTAIGAADFTVAIKKHDGTAGTTQTIYWVAYK